MSYASAGLVLLIVFAAGCGPSSAEPAPCRPPDQSYHAALELWCQVDERAGLGTLEDPIEKSQRRSDWLTDHVKNPDAIYLKTMLSVKTQTDQAKELRAEAKGAGVAACPLADTLERGGL